MIKLYEYGPTRSARVRWTLQELEMEFEGIEARSMIRTPELRAFHPQAKLPAAEIDGKALFESAAICAYLADQAPEKGLLAPSGNWERALHDQWCYFALTEIEAWLWSNAKHTSFYPEELRVAEVVGPNNQEIASGLAALEDVLSSADFLVADRFSLTDIVVSYTVNWARRAGQLEEFPHLDRYLERLYERPHCALTR